MFIAFCWIDSLNSTCIYMFLPVGEGVLAGSYKYVELRV